MAITVIDIDDVLNPALKNTGNQKLSINKIVPILAADNDNDVKIFGQLPPFAVVNDIKVTCTAITGGTDFNIGIYKRDISTGEFTEMDDNLYADALDLSSAIAEGSAISGKAEIGVADRVKPLYELLGETLPKLQHTYFLGIKGVTIGTADGTIGIDVDYTILNG